MDLLALPPVAAVIDTAYRALIALTTLLEPFAGTAAAAAAVVVVTLLVRTALVPVGVSQAKAERSRARLAPRLADLQRRHRNAPERLQRETMQLYADEGTTPFAGCLPMLVQAPVVGVIYAVFVHAQIARQRPARPHARRGAARRDPARIPRRGRRDAGLRGAGGADRAGR
jgi:YidC/Oxa1 family membrane protein insertase